MVYMKFKSGHILFTVHFIVQKSQCIPSFKIGLRSVKSLNSTSNKISRVFLDSKMLTGITTSNAKAQKKPYK